MPIIRTSTREDLPRLRLLWTLAFGDSGPYQDNFFRTYYQPERMLVLEEEGVIQAMTAWFDTQLVLPGRDRFRAAYLYAVATHPEARSRGLAGQLLSWADNHFRSQSIPSVTTVPAEPSLHQFFGRNGFRECFVHREQHWTQPSQLDGPALTWEPLLPARYAALRESLLADLPHIALPEEAIAYQAGACALTPGGGLYGVETPAGWAILCAEGMEDGQLLVKELLGCPQALEHVLPQLPRLLPQWSGLYRTPGHGTAFGMLKWLDSSCSSHWDWSTTAYLGLAFD